MKNTMKFLGIIVLVTVIGFSMIACGSDNDDGGDGTTFTDLWAFGDWLKKQPENTPDEPYRVKLNFKDVNFGFSAWNLTLYSPSVGSWSNPNKYVYLDCSGSPFTNVEEGGFKECATLVGIIIPNSVTIIYSGAFYHCTNLTSITLPNNITDIEQGTFDGCTKLTSITIPTNVTSIGNDAFANTGLTSVTIPNNVTYLSGFNGCLGLTDITIPNSVATIGRDAFYGCTGLTSVAIPSSVTGINVGAFNNTNITSVTFEGTIPKSDFKDWNIYLDIGSSGPPFPGDLRAKFYATDEDNGTPGTYTRQSGSNTWELQP